jgi:EmrB/QacA subfamily drug resistance transporter
VGGAIASPTALALIQNTFPDPHERARAMGVYAAMSGAGGSLGLLLGGVLTDVASWRWVLFVNVPIGLAVAIAAPFVLATSEAKPGRLDLPGALSVTVGMSLFVYALSHAAAHGWATAGTFGPLAAAVVLLVAFVLVELRSPHALMPLRIFADRDRAAAYAIMLCLASAMFGTFFFITQFVQDILGYSPLRAGVAFLPMTFAIGGTSMLMSRLVSRIGMRRPMTVGPLLASGGLLLLSLLTVHSGYGAVILPLLMIAVGMGCTFVPLTLTVMQRVAPQEAGLASALLNTSQQIGGSLGLAVIVTVASAFTTVVAGHAPTHAAVTHGYDAGFRVASLVALCGFVLAAVVLRRPRPVPSALVEPPEVELEAVVA